MKKSIVLCALLLTFIAALPLQAYAATNQEKIAENIKALEHVKDAEVVVYGSNCIIALQTENVQQKSQCKALKDAARKEAEKVDDSLTNVIVTCNVKVFRELRNLNSLSEAERQKAIEEMLRKFADRPKKQPIRMPEDKQNLLVLM